MIMWCCPRDFQIIIIRPSTSSQAQVIIYKRLDELDDGNLTRVKYFAIKLDIVKLLKDDPLFWEDFSLCKEHLKVAFTSIFNQN